jgi:hypothetical protein
MKTSTTVTFITVEIVIFALASLLHQGILASGYEHAKAALAETAIAVVLAIGLGYSLYQPRASRAAALWVQGFALLGVCVGILMILIGVGPRTRLDFAIHTVMLIVLISGLIATRRTPR